MRRSTHLSAKLVTHVGTLFYTVRRNPVAKVEVVFRATPKLLIVVRAAADVIPLTRAGNGVRLNGRYKYIRKNGLQYPRRYCFDGAWILTSEELKRLNAEFGVSS